MICSFWDSFVPRRGAVPDANLSTPDLEGQALEPALSYRMSKSEALLACLEILKEDPQLRDVVSGSINGHQPTNSCCGNRGRMKGTPDPGVQKSRNSTGQVGCRKRANECGMGISGTGARCTRLGLVSRHRAPRTLVRVLLHLDSLP